MYVRLTDPQLAGQYATLWERGMLEEPGPQLAGHIAGLLSVRLDLTVEAVQHNMCL